MLTKIIHLSKLIFLLALVLIDNSIVAQESDQTGLISTNASNNQNVNVDLFHGRHKIHIPVYTYKSRHLSLPISLNYSPIDTSKDDVYHAGIVGLGWNLTAGGAISRNIQGIPDESPGSDEGYYKGNFNNFNVNYKPSNPSDARSFEADEDEFSFSFCGYSGSFIFHRGKWVFDSDTNFEIYMLINKYNVLVGFTLQAPDGIVYSFGGLDEYNNTKGVEFSGFGRSSIMNPTTWYLTKIESTEGDQINLSYKNSEYISGTPITKTTRSKSYHQYTMDGIEWLWNPQKPSLDETFPTVSDINNSEAYNGVKTVRLTGITSPTRNISVQLNSSVIYEKAYVGVPLNYNVSYKLDDIEIIDESNSQTVFKKIEFNYYDRTNDDLLKLKSFQEFAKSTTNNNQSLPPYQFEYESVTSQLAPQVLNKIIYTTGGYSEFEFIREEAVEDYGYRISKKISANSETDQKIITEYFFTPNGGFGSTAQSSRPNSTYEHTFILDYFLGNVPSRIKMDKVTEYDYTYADELPNPNVKTVSVGYSTVHVLQTLEDELGSTTFLTGKRYDFINYNDERKNLSKFKAGKIINEENYDAQNNLVSSTRYNYKYNNFSQIHRFCTKSFRYKDLNNEERIHNTYGSYYTISSPYNLVEKIETVNDNETVTKYEYDPGTNYMTKISVIEPNSQLSPSYPDTTSTFFRYIYEFDDPNGNTGYEYYRDGYHIIKNLPVETITKKNGKVVAGQFIDFINVNTENYQNPVPRFRKPHKIYTLAINSPITDYNEADYYWGFDNRYKLLSTYEYDKYGNVIQMQNDGDAPVSYYYSSDEMLPLLKIQGMSYVAFKAAIELRNLFPYVPNHVKQMRKDFSGAMITSYEYDSKFGVKSITYPNGNKISKEYDDFGRLIFIKDHNGNILLSNEYNTTP